jgi:hypothetical protein
LKLFAHRRRVLAYHAKGWNNERIAEHLGITVHQVEMILIAWGPKPVNT